MQFTHFTFPHPTAPMIAITFPCSKHAVADFIPKVHLLLAHVDDKFMICIADRLLVDFCSPFVQHFDFKLLNSSPDKKS